VLLEFWLVKVAHKHVGAINPFWVNFTNIFCAAFTHSDQKAQKYTVKQSIFFALLGFERIKATCKHVGEINTRSCLCKDGR